jgi:Protein of unknown function (DUF3768)
LLAARNNVPAVYYYTYFIRDGGLLSYPISEIYSAEPHLHRSHSPWRKARNDELRQRLIGGLAVITPGVAALGQEAVARIVKTIEVYDDFCHANDPHQEHDFGTSDADGRRVFFKHANHACLSRGMSIARSGQQEGTLDRLTLSAPIMA